MKILKLPRDATVEDLYELDEKAELVNGQISLLTPTGFLPHRAALNVTFDLRTLEAERAGYAVGGGAAFVVDLPKRKSFSPDAAWYTGEPTGGPFMQGAPAFAVEVRGEGDYAARRA